MTVIMRKTTIHLAIAAFFCLLATSCFKEPHVQGYLGDGIYLQGADTMYVTIGTKTASSTAWLDNSTKPCKFEIYDVRDEDGKHVDGFFKTFPTMLWTQPYDYLTDKTEADVLSKLQAQDLTPLMINSVNGQLRAMESTAMIGLKDGDVFHVDVKVSNSKGSKILEDYAILCFQKGADGAGDFVITDFVNGICIMNAAGENTFPFYDQINSGQTDFETRRQNIYTDNGKEKYVRVYKKSAEPNPGIHVTLRFLDKNGNLFDPAGYATYAGLVSYIDYSVNRQNTDKGLEMDFPVTPWPVKTDLYQYLRGPVFLNFDNMDFDALKADNLAGKIPYNAKWPSDNYQGANGWYVRLRSMMTFYQPGSYVIEVTVPYTSAI